MTPGRLLQLIREGKPAHVLVDVRTPAEYESGHIPTAVNIPVDVIGAKPPVRTKDALIVVYCRSGNRSATARQILMDLGYTNVVDFGAVSRWEEPLVTGKEPGRRRSSAALARRVPRWVARARAFVTCRTNVHEPHTRHRR